MVIEQMHVDQLKAGVIIANDPEHGRLVVLHNRVAKLDIENPNNSIIATRVIKFGSDTEPFVIEWPGNTPVFFEWYGHQQVAVRSNKMQSLSDMEAADHMAFSNQRCR